MSNYSVNILASIPETCATSVPFTGHGAEWSISRFTPAQPAAFLLRLGLSCVRRAACCC